MSNNYINDTRYSVSDSSLVDYEISFNQDFNGDGTVGETRYLYGAFLSEKGISKFSNDALKFFRDFNIWGNNKFGKENGDEWLSFDQDSIYKSGKFFEIYGIITKSTDFKIIITL